MLKFILAILLTVGGGASIGFITAGESSGEWFRQLSKPSYQPPSWLFGPVWTILYALMGIALFLVWKLPASKERNRSISIFIVQLAFNFAWSIIFFKMHSPFAAFIDIIILWVMILVTIFRFAKDSKAAAWLLVPYVAWVSFASVLNYDIMRMN